MELEIEGGGCSGGFKSNSFCDPQLDSVSRRLSGDGYLPNPHLNDVLFLFDLQHKSVK